MEEQSQQPHKSKALALTSFFFGLTFWMPLLNLVFGPVAMILGIRALLKIRKNPDKYGGLAFAIAGTVLGAGPIFFSLVGLGMCLYGKKEICTSMGLLFLS